MCRLNQVHRIDIQQSSSTQQVNVNSIISKIDAFYVILVQIHSFMREHAAKNPIRQILQHVLTSQSIVLFSNQISALAEVRGSPPLIEQYNISAAIQQDSSQLFCLLQTHGSLKNIQSQFMDTLVDIERTLQTQCVDFPPDSRLYLKSLLISERSSIISRCGRALAPHRIWEIERSDIQFVYNNESSTFAVLYETRLGTVYKAIWGNRNVAIQMINGVYSQDAVDTIVSEIDHAHLLDHPNIVKIWRVCLNTDSPFLVMPLMKMDLTKFLRCNSMTSMETRVGFLLDIAKGLAYLHSQPIPILQGELRASGVLYGYDDKIAISDSGISRTISLSTNAATSMSKSALAMNSSELSKRYYASHRWVAPERYYQNYCQHPASDIFSFGMTAYEILTGWIPFHHERDEEVIAQWISKGIRPYIPCYSNADGGNVTSTVWQIVTDAWHADIRQRPTAWDIVERLENVMTYGFLDHEDEMHFSKHATMSNIEVRVHDGSSGCGKDEPSVSSMASVATNAMSISAIISPSSAEFFSDSDARNSSISNKDGDKIIMPNAWSTTATTTFASAIRDDNYNNLNQLGAFQDCHPIISTPQPPSQSNCSLANLPTSNISDIQILVDSLPNWTAQMGINSQTPLSKQHKLYIICNASGNIIKLRLGNNGIGGQIPASIGDLNHLCELRDLFKNNLTGNIPKEIGNLTKLSELSLYQNDLQGAIPTEIGKLVNLTELNLSTNNLSGHIPHELGNLTKLNKLNLYNNQLTGEIPRLGNLKRLCHLGLYENRLSGRFPIDVCLLVNLTKLNQMDGSMRTEIGNLTNLVELKINYNQLSGSIPPEIGRLSRLSVLVLSSNRFSGAVPCEIIQLARLQKFSYRQREVKRRKE
ncbi:hypothetical protein BDEG_25146 [Batrachochytrium dendrobatidis JEL423]|uniref:Protein kinase domain-containing protein n=1 Tax=Batrachochytrium dendrobatidis (strain JEL423) TaxID=403673 RepID=A0A177WQE4_BATDL|nr:hypothetical protein BDEG_25146 [Batrachochytrium dendrobatidis JEL423]